MLDYDEFLLTPPDTVSTARTDNYHRVVASPSSIQLARERLRRSFEETEAVNRIDNVMASRNRFQARTGGSESVIVSTSSFRFSVVHWLKFWNPSAAIVVLVYFRSGEC